VYLTAGSLATPSQLIEGLVLPRRRFLGLLAMGGAVILGLRPKWAEAADPVWTEQDSQSSSLSIWSPEWDSTSGWHVNVRVYDPWGSEISNIHVRFTYIDLGDGSYVAATVEANDTDASSVTGYSRTESSLGVLIDGLSQDIAYGEVSARLGYSELGNGLAAASQFGAGGGGVLLDLYVDTTG
jgi:hypothetical protein